MISSARFVWHLIAFCPFCNAPLSPMERLLAERDPVFQCHHCWNPVRESRGPAMVHVQGGRRQRKAIPINGKRHRR